MAQQWVLQVKWYQWSWDHMTAVGGDRPRCRDSLEASCPEWCQDLHLRPQTSWRRPETFYTDWTTAAVMGEKGSHDSQVASVLLWSTETHTHLLCTHVEAHISRKHTAILPPQRSDPQQPIVPAVTSLPASSKTQTHMFRMYPLLYLSVYLETEQLNQCHVRVFSLSCCHSGLHQYIKFVNCDFGVVQIHLRDTNWTQDGTVLVTKNYCFFLLWWPEVNDIQISEPAY